METPLVSSLGPGMKYIQEINKENAAIFIAQKSLTEETSDPSMGVALRQLTQQPPHTRAAKPLD